MKNGDPTRTRTPNLLIRSQLLYPVELWENCTGNIYKMFINSILYAFQLVTGINTSQ